MSDPKKPPLLTEEQLAAAREAVSQPGFDELMASLPPELRRIVEQAKVAMASEDPTAAFEALAEQAAKVPEGISPEALESLIASTVADAVAQVGDTESLLSQAGEIAGALKGAVAQVDRESLAAEPGAKAAADAVQSILDRLEALDLQGLIGPVLGDVRALQAELRALPGKLSRVRADPSRAQKHLEALEERALHLQAAAAELGGGELLRQLGSALGDAEVLLDALEERSPALALTRAAVLARSGDRKGSQEAFAHTLDLAEAQGVMDVASTAATAMQLDALQRGDLRTAIDLARRVTALARKTGDDRKVVLSTYDEGLLLARIGKAADGEPLVIGALDQAKAMGRRDLIARGLVVLAKIREGEGDENTARGIYEGLLADEGVPGLESEVAQGAMGVLRLIPTDALVDPLRFRCLAIVRAWSRRLGDADTFAQSSLLLAESEEARGDRLAALRAVLEGREAMRAAPGSNPEPMDRALRQLRGEWGEEAFDALMKKLSGPPPAEAK